MNVVETRADWADAAGLALPNDLLDRLRPIIAGELLPTLSLVDCYHLGKRLQQHCLWSSVLSYS